MFQARVSPEMKMKLRAVAQDAELTGAARRVLNDLDQ
jgi:hypothetical protein